MPYETTNEDFLSSVLLKALPSHHMRARVKFKLANEINKKYNLNRKYSISSKRPQPTTMHDTMYGLFMTISVWVLAVVSGFGA